MEGLDQTKIGAYSHIDKMFPTHKSIIYRCICKI